MSELNELKNQLASIAKAVSDLERNEGQVSEDKVVEAEFKTEEPTPTDAGDQEQDAKEDNPISIGLVIFKRKDGSYGINSMGQLDVDSAVGLVDILRTYVEAFRNTAVSNMLSKEEKTEESEPQDSDK